MDHKSFQLVGPIALHGKEDYDFQTLYMGIYQTSFKNSHVDGVSNDSKKSVDEESKVLLVTTPKT